MKICLILEGCYPYVRGGVSTWMHQYITEMKEHEFVLWVIAAKAEDRDKFVYTLPDNVKKVYQVFLDEALNLKENSVLNHHFTKDENEVLRELINSGSPDWDLLFDMYQVRKINPVDYLKSQAFLNNLTEGIQEKHPHIAFADAFHSARSRLLPVLYLLGGDIPKADVYHSICTGYGGMLACLGAYINNKPIVLTEHGIYTREREEEIIGAKWVGKAFKKHWISFFYMLSDLIYKRALKITSLYQGAMRTQIELGCPPERCRVIANGISYEKFAAVRQKTDDGYVDIGAVIRFAPIKDVKTLIYSFFELTTRMDNVRLHIMGSINDREYYDECIEIINQLGIGDKIIIPGQVNIVEYFEKLDFTILSSISEGQPLSILESFAAHLPVVSTDVGSCSELINGVAPDNFGPAGFYVPPMQREKLADAMEKMCLSKELREKTGDAGQKRAYEYFRYPIMLENYKKVYKEVEKEWQE